MQLSNFKKVFTFKCAFFEMNRYGKDGMWATRLNYKQKFLKIHIHPIIDN